MISIQWRCCIARATAKAQQLSLVNSPPFRFADSTAPSADANENENICLNINLILYIQSCHIISNILRREYIIVIVAIADADDGASSSVIVTPTQL